MKLFYCVSSILLLSDNGLWGCRPKAMHCGSLFLSSLVTFHKNIFSTFKTKPCVLQCTSKATICGRRLVLQQRDWTLWLHRNPKGNLRKGGLLHERLWNALNRVDDSRNRHSVDHCVHWRKNEVNRPNWPNRRFTLSHLYRTNRLPVVYFYL